MKVSKSRGKRDMRPQTTKPRAGKLGGVRTGNMFENLCESDDEDEEAIRPNMQPVNKAPRWVRVNKDAGILSVDFNKPQEIGAVAHVDGEWERIPAPTYREKCTQYHGDILAHAK